MKKKKILVLDGHPDEESYTNALSNAYAKGAESAGHEVQRLKVRELEFNPNLAFGYRKRMELEPDLIEAQEKLKWAEHVVLLFPVWWGSMPALLKGFFDRTFLPGFAFQKRENSLWWDRLLTHKTGHIVSAMDQPAWYYNWVYGKPSFNAVKKLTFHFVGIKKVKTTAIGPVKNSTDKFRANWLKRVEEFGKKGK